MLLAGPVSAAGARAQTWPTGSDRPLLWQITSVDSTGEASWPYGQEDIAGDGLDTFMDDESGTDIRTVYADADDRRVWIRAYVASESAPSQRVVAFFFLDTDDDDGTGGDALGHESWPPWTADPSRGGYERALAMSADGTVLGAFGWNAQDDLWEELSTSSSALRAEAGVDQDPIRIGNVQRGYVQVDALHTLSGLSASCDANLFVRLFHEDPETRNFGDDDHESDVVACRPSTDGLGDPDVLRSAACDADADCPNDGRCLDGTCFFAYACSSDADCRTDETCTDDRCVLVVDASCDDHTDCDSLVCDGDRCVACTETGATTCAEQLWCAPDGRCIDPEQVQPGGDGSGGSGDDEPQVRGGAFRCTAIGARPGVPSVLWLGLLAVPYFGARRIRRGSGTGTRS